jgi:hypothetical protein
MLTVALRRRVPEQSAQAALRRRESIWVKVATGKNKFKIIRNVYRPNSALADLPRALTSQETMITLIKSNPAYKKCEIWICGDLNLDFLNLEQHGPTKLHYEFMLAWNFLPVIMGPTRVTANTSTLIDHIFVKNAAKTLIAGVIVQELADNYPTFIIEPGTTRGARSLPYF